MNRLACLAIAAAACLAAACTSQSSPPQRSGAPAKTTEDSKDAKDAKAEKAGDPKAADAKEGKLQPKGKQVPPPPDVAAAPADATKTAGGVSIKVLEPGTGDKKPGVNDTVKVEYTGWTTDGVTFDTTDGRDPRSFQLSKVVPGWTEGLQELTVGTKARLWIPEELAYKGKKGAPQGMLVFDVKLVEVIAAPETPEDVAQPPADAKKTKSGLAYKRLVEGTGKKKPNAWDKVKVNYSGWTTDGKMFDSSLTRNRPAEFPLGGVIPGWTEGIPLMVVGDQTRFWIPKELAYNGKPGKPEGMLVFDVELLEIIAQPKPPPLPKTPKDVAAPPKDAKKTDSGLAYKVLKKGKGKDKPTADSRVTVHYTGWTTDGKMFDSSIKRGRPATFPLKGVIKGWTEGLQLMVVGQRTRFWIPVDLAYQGRPGKPAGMLVFDVELIEIQ